jgi:hypothetical protein
MKRRITALLVGLGFAALFLTAAAGSVQAALGESADSVASDQTASHETGFQNGRQRLYRPGAPFRFRHPAGIYCPDRHHICHRLNGLIPDLTSLLGSYAGEYRTALQHALRQRSRHRKVETDQIVVKNGDT